MSKLLRLDLWSGKLNFPPNTCMPRSEKMTMKRKRRRSREAMERTELRREATRLLKAFQYLQNSWKERGVINDIKSAARSFQKTQLTL